MKLCIIIPIFNGEDRIRECVKSLELQTDKDFDTIIVNDGSTDNSLNVCKDIKSVSNLRIQIFDQANSGPLSARLRGVESTDSDYILFLDCDDILSRHAIERLKDVIFEHPNDIIIFRYASIINGKRTQSRSLSITGNLEVKKAKYLLCSDEINSVWGKCYPRFVFENNLDELRQLANKRFIMAEDLLMLQVLFRKNENYYYLDEVLYIYGDDGASHTMDIQKWKQTITVHKQLVRESKWWYRIAHYAAYSNLITYLSSYIIWAYCDNPKFNPHQVLDRVLDNAEKHDLLLKLSNPFIAIRVNPVYLLILFCAINSYIRILKCLIDKAIWLRDLKFRILYRN